MTIEQIEKFFEGRKLPERIKLKDWEIVVDPDWFIKSHMQFLRKNTGKKRFMPYYDRLIETIKILQNECR